MSARWSSGAVGPARLLIATAVPSLRQRLHRAAAHAGMKVVADVGSVRDPVQTAMDCQPDVCALDIGLHGRMVSAAAEIACVLHRVRILALDPEPDDAVFLEAILAGADGYLSADSSASELATGLRDVLAGAAPMPRRFLATLVDEFRAVSLPTTGDGR